MDDLALIRIGPPSVGYVRETIARLPLADAVLHLLRYVLEDGFLCDLYERHRGRGYEDILSFSSVVSILTDALLVHKGSGRQALLGVQKHDQLPTVKEAFYGKLRRLPIDLSIAFLTEASERILQIFPTSLNPLPESLHGFDLIIVDGKKTKHVSKRLKLTRNLAGRLFGAKFLVGYDPVTRLIRNAVAHPDGERNDSPLVPDLLAEIGPATERRPRIIVSDSQFCDLVQIDRYRQAKFHFVLRYHPKLHFHPDPARRAINFTDAKGRRLIEEHGWLGATDDPRRCYVRRITWLRTDHKDLLIVTDLLNVTSNSGDPASIPAADLMDVYLIRWRIETVFQEVTTVFGLKKLIGSTAEATAFQVAFCMVIYNIIQVIRGYVAQAQPQPLSVDDISNAMLFESIRRELISVFTVIPPVKLASAVRQLATAEEMRSYLATRIAGLWEPGWRKARNKNPRVYGPKKKGSGAHTSVYRVLQEHKLKNKTTRDTG
jgi:hypothetical protein